MNKKLLLIISILFIISIFVVYEILVGTPDNFRCDPGKYTSFYQASTEGEKKSKWAKSPVTIFFSKDNKVINRITIQDLSESVFSVWNFPCNVYISRIIYNDKLKSKELWQYSFDSISKKIIDLSNYSYSFHIDPTERYITLERSYLGQPDYALVVKDLVTTEDILEVSLAEIVAQYPYLESSLGMNGWSSDGNYFWGNIFDGADVLALVRIDMKTKTWKVFVAPTGMLGGDAFNVNTNWTTYDDGLPWTGDADLDAINAHERETRGEVLNFYIYNLITKERRLLETINNVSWSFKPEWISDTELLYQVPGNSDKHYKL